MEQQREHATLAEQAGVKVGTEQQEPGAATRHVDEHGKPQDSEIEQIARQQGATQRGYTADGPHEDRPAQFDPEHPGGRPEGDPRR